MVVGEEQNAFIKGRYILDGVLIANETMEFLKKKKEKGLIFKIDFEKAYDSINWNFLINIMKRMGFGEKWCHWVDVCLRSASISILVNGSPTEEFGFERGVRQGDPLSLFLFILAAEGLNAIMNEAVINGIFRVIKVGRNNVMVSHLQYADDTIFFGEWNKENAKSLMCILKCFEEVSGLCVNYCKSKLYGIEVNEGEVREMAAWMGCGVGEFPFTYLGLPIGKNMRRVNAWNPVVESWMGVGLEFSSSFVGVLGDGRDIRFWVDRWVDNRRLCDKFPRLFHLDRKKEGSVMDKGLWGQMDMGDKFKVKELTRLAEEKILQVENGYQETIWNKLVPKKVNIFNWRALKGRLPVRVELDRRGIELDSLLCPSCNNSVESCAHSLVTCDLAMSVWEKIFNWWKIGIVNAFSIDEFFSSYGNAHVPVDLSSVWQAVLWSSGYFIWKERNACVFGNKISSTNKIVQDIQLKSYEWITRRSNKYKAIDWQQWLWDP
ncbi:reverse transcriptase domain, reverse transcriptase zinc-binding domain protein [Tanacetum coccineum]